MFERQPGRQFEGGFHLKPGQRRSKKEPKGRRDGKQGRFGLAVTSYMRHGVAMPISSSRTLPRLLEPFRSVSGRSPGQATSGRRAHLKSGNVGSNV
jgi:hypothetical protein